MSTPETTLTQADITRIVKHMNEDHADSVLAYVHHFGKKLDATEAKIVTVTQSELSIQATVAGTSENIQIQFDHPLESAHDAHMTMVKMSKEAKRALSS